MLPGALFAAVLANCALADIPMARPVEAAALFILGYILVLSWTRIETLLTLKLKDRFQPYAPAHGGRRFGPIKAVPFQLSRGTERSRISRLRMGILSILRLISRTSHGKGLRILTAPSLPMSTSMNPRGRSLRRSCDIFSGSVSAITTTSRALTTPSVLRRPGRVRSPRIPRQGASST